ncbi:MULTISPECIES: monovalent cation/H(+) antiporter subunit G [Paenibacillus]|uniref:Monovalent cation/H(+) antiporter subunit G n=1 Tax=Paenibacillus urinalis TaxID=521520 RepID=A0AAX3N0H6_9BACL|nr:MULTISPECIES: monovalent cation/H(+) antiporter subunit G [Paenibacillus]WDH82808.1 monovalent cation/H(+) antiporter subunit G [Paenibacillus urinalis]
MTMIFSVIVGLLVLFGAVLSVLSAYGLIRLPDVYLRAHAATKSNTLGILCILSGSFLFFIVYDGYVSARLLLGILFVFLTAPVAGHLNGRAAYRTDVPLWKGSALDELAKALKGKKRQLLENEEVSVDSLEPEPNRNQTKHE